MTPIRYNIEASLGSIVRRAERAMINRLNQKFKSSGYDITTEQYRVLVNLWNNDGQNQQELAEATYKNKTTLTRLINNLEKRNLVVRVPDKTDNRNKHVYLTRRGKELPKELTQFARQTLIEAQCGIPRGEIKICKDVLQRVIRNLTS
jgi:DNA-binding MarR family transcriptional regulator